MTSTGREVTLFSCYNHPLLLRKLHFSPCNFMGESIQQFIYRLTQCYCTLSQWHCMLLAQNSIHLGDILNENHLNKHMRWMQYLPILHSIIWRVTPIPCLNTRDWSSRGFFRKASNANTWSCKNCKAYFSVEYAFPFYDIQRFKCKNIHSSSIMCKCWSLISITLHTASWVV